MKTPIFDALIAIAGGITFAVVLLVVTAISKLG